MAKSLFVLLVVVLGSALVSAQTPVQISGQSLLDPPAALNSGASPVSCSQSQAITIPRPVLERAKAKARLVNLLRESIYDDARGIVNAAREKEIRKLADKLRKGTRN